MNQNNSILKIKQVLFVVLFIETLIITIAFARAAFLDISPKTYFNEIDDRGYVTYISFLQLIIAAVLAKKISRIAKFSSKLRKSSSVWLICSIVLFFLALDDLVGIHEQIDLWIHDLFELEKTNLTDLIDDFIVGLYLVLVTIFLAFQWQNLKIFNPVFIFFKIGFILALAMIILDLVSNNTLFISKIIENETLQSEIQQWLGAVEDSIKIYAEGLFMVGIYGCWQIANSLRSQ